MPAFIDLTNKVFGLLTVLNRSSITGNGPKPATYWNCVCQCGKKKTIAVGSLRSGNTKSCGCLSIAKATKHNMCFTHEYNSWQGMKKRCKQYDTYLSKGITVCPEWINSFITFFNDMGNSPSAEHTIDRIDNNKGYYKENCRWATTKEQNRNYSQNRHLTHNGKTMIVTEWAEYLGIDRFLIYNRLQRGWSVEKSLSLIKHP